MAYLFTADTHFGQERTLRLSKRPFDSVTEMDRALVNNWNRTVSKNDTVFVLGDFGQFHYTKFLNGNIYLIQGNYSRPVSNDELNTYFDKVYASDINLDETISYVIGGVATVAAMFVFAKWKSGLKFKV